MSSTRGLARTAGLLYLIVAVLGGFSEMYVRSSVTVAGDAAATASNIAQHATLFRIGFLTDLVAFAAFLGAGLILYVLLKPVNPPVAMAMLALNAVSVAISALNMLNQLGALLVATDPTYTAGLSSQAAGSLALLLLEMHRQGYLIAQVFFGLYLVPLGYLVYRSGLFPRVMGGVLVLGAAGYVSDLVVTYASPSFQSGASTYLGMVGGLAEMVFLLWLLVFGAGARSTAATRTSMEVAQ
jgi:hypothetical protein